MNIGLPHLKPSRGEEYNNRQKSLFSTRKSSTGVNSPIQLELVRKEWLKTSGPFHVKAVAEHFNIFKDLFGDAYFLPRVPLSIQYQQPEGSSMPVYYGNQIKPKEVKIKIQKFLRYFVF